LKTRAYYKRNIIFRIRGKMVKKATRIYTGPDGESHFEDIEIALDEKKGADRRQSAPMKATEIIFIEQDSGYEHGWHNAPCRQFVITLEGECEIEIGDDIKRIFGPGDVLLAEDTTGRGHISRVVSKQPRKAIFIPLA
ncbi:MAG: hypothetical protein ACXAEX_22980, partial [Promethearchaeota archaeon]